MKLTISAHLGQPVPAAAAHSAVFPPNGGSLGHRSDNTLVLDDRHGTIAGRHATVYRGIDGWRITPEPGATVAVNGHSVAHGHEWPLQLGDVLEIGPYLLTPGEEHSPWSGLSPSAPAAVPPPASRPHPLQADPARQQAVDDPLAAIGTRTGLEELQDTPLDPLALFSAEGLASTAPGGQEDPLLAGFDLGLPSEPVRPGFGPAIADATPEHTGHLRMQIQWPEHEAAAVESAAAGQPPPAASSAAAIEPLLQAFLEGLGHPADDWPGPEFMHLLGAVLRTLRASRP